MCVAIWLLEDHPVYSFLLAHNRDELYSRKTYPIHWWEEPGNILAGRDGKEGGTWLALSANGRLAFVTNIREPLTNDNAVTRGHLPIQFLQSTMAPAEHVEGLAAKANNYNGFNLVVADLCSRKMACYSHSLKYGDRSTLDISRGVHGVSNGFFESNWPKVDRGKQKLKELLQRYPNEEIPEEMIVEELLQDKTVYDDAVLPETGVTLERERLLAPMFVSIDTPQDHYGTMCMTVVAVRRNGHVSVYEKYANGRTWTDHRFQFQNARKWTVEQWLPDGVLVECLARTPRSSVPDSIMVSRKWRHVLMLESSAAEDWRSRGRVVIGHLTSGVWKYTMILAHVLEAIPAALMLVPAFVYCALLPKWTGS